MTRSAHNRYVNFAVVGKGATVAEVLIVGSDWASRAVAVALAGADLTVARGETAEVALYEHGRRDLDVVVCAAALPGMDGIELCRVLKERGGVAVVVTTAGPGTSEVLDAFAAGADDVIVMPCHPDEIRARVRALVRRTRGALRPRRTIRIGRFVARRDDDGAVTPIDADVYLSPLEQSVLELLAERPGCVVALDVLARRAEERHGSVPPALLEHALRRLTTVLAAAGATGALQHLPDGSWRLAAA